MLQNAKVTAFNVFQVLRENQQWGKNTGLKLTIEIIEECVETQLKLTIKTQKLHQ